MSGKCFICDKSFQMNNKVSHANNKKSIRSNPNLQKIRIMDGKSVKRRSVCTRCIRSNKIVKRVSRTASNAQPK